MINEEMTAKELDAWCEKNGLVTRWKPGMSKKKLRGLINDELRGDINAPQVTTPAPLAEIATAETVTESAPAEEPPKKRSNGEIIKKCADGVDMGINYLNERRDMEMRMAEERKNRPTVPSRQIPQEGRKATRIARQLRK